MAAVESGDEETAQRMADEAAKKAGYTMKVYHGTPNKGFTQFRDWSYFTPNKAYADLYQRATYSSGRGLNGSEQAGTYALYMNPGRTFDTRNADAAAQYEEIRQEMGMGELGDKGLPDWNDAGDLIDYIEENGLPYDTIVLDEGGTMELHGQTVERGISYVSKGTQVKDAAAITYDDSGNVIPLSERFNMGNNDIRFELRGDTDTDTEAQALEDVRDDAELFAQMNMDEDARAALLMLRQLHNLTTRGGQDALIQRGAFEKMLRRNEG